LKPFTLSSSAEEELEKIVCGVSSRDPEWENREELIRNIQPDHGFNRSSIQYTNFIRYIMELSQENRPQFIKFLTGSKRLPLGGFKSLSPNLTFVLKKGENADKVLPSVMACQNYLKCPTYSTYEIMKR
jgi:E3 ubiquitin-protein ligase TRIP12